MDKEGLLELLPHYIILVGLIFGVLAVVNALFGDVGFWPRLGLAVLVGLLYPRVVRELGVAPSQWEKR